jgi:thiol:disulfide interchange protein
MKKLFSKTVVSIMVLALVGLAIYFANVELQSYYGRQTLAKSNRQNHRLDEALKKALSKNKLVLVDVAAIWCPTCRRLDNEIFANPQVQQKINEKYIFSRLEYESAEGTEFLEKHQATGFPNLWLLDGNGNVVKKLQVTFEPSEFLKQLP